MTQDELIEMCGGGFYENFADEMTDRVLGADAFDTLFVFMESCGSLSVSKSLRDKLEFRSSYILERIYFRNPQLFIGYHDRFFERLPSITNHSQRRHFTKIAVHMMDAGWMPRNADDIAAACAEWAVTSETKTAVKVWAVEVLLRLSSRVEWVHEVLADVFETLAKDSSPGIESRLRQWRYKVR